MQEKLIKVAWTLDYPEIQNSLYGDPYNISKLKIITYSTKYEILGRGVIDSEFFNISDDIKKKLEAFNEYFIPISSEEDLKAFEDRVKNENIKTEKEKILSEEELKEKIKQKIEEQVPEKTEEEKRKIFDLAIQAPTKKSEVKDYYWKIFDIVGTAIKTREILNIKMEKAINKNEFKEKDKPSKEEKNDTTNK